MILCHMNNFYKYSNKFVRKEDSGSYVFSKDKPQHKTWNTRCDKMWSRLVNHEGPNKESIEI